MEKFNCKVCGNQHELYYNSMALLEPDLLYNMSDEEKTTRVKTYDFFHLVDDSYFLTKANLFLKIQGKDKFMHWEVWVKLGLREFHQMAENLKHETSIIEGELFVQIPNYKDSLGTKVKLTYYLDNKIDLPEVEVLNNQSELGLDFANGLSYKKVISWMEQIYHPTSTASNK